MSATNDPSFPRIFYILTPLLAMVAAVLVFELAFAVVAPVPFASERNMYYTPDPYTGFRLQPNSAGGFMNDIVATVNRHGHRDDEVSLAKPEGTLRILVLGDSFTMGANVRQEEIFTEVLEELLDERSDRPVEVVNSGVGGWTPFQYAQYYEHYGRAFEADLVLVAFFAGNDAYNAVAETEQTLTAVMGRRVKRESVEEAPWRTRLKIAVYARSHLVRLYFNRGLFAITGDQLQIREEARDGDLFTPRYLEVQKRRGERNHRLRSRRSYELNRNCVDQIVRVRDLARELGTPTRVVVIPDENQINRSLYEGIFPAEERHRYDLDMPQSLLLEMFAERGVEVLDLMPVFRADERRLYMNDTHWNPPGHRLAAAKILDWIEPDLAAITGG